MSFAGTLPLLATLCFAAPAPAADKPLVIDLWPGKPPDEPGTIGAEYVRMSPKLDRKQVEVTDSTRMITNVTKPTLTVYRPAKDKDTGTAVLICPGGGYWNLYWELEGEEVAAWLNSIGVTGIILKYRVPAPARRAEGASRPAARSRTPSGPSAWCAARRRSGASHPDRIGIVGFSAGGHLAVATATSFEKRTYEAIDEIDKVSCRPDFAIPVYSGYLKAKDKDELAAGLSVPKGTPPMFLAHGGADLISDPEHSVVLYRALKRAGVSAELHVYATAAHDFGVRDSGRPCSTWTRSCAGVAARPGVCQVAAAGSPRAARQRSTSSRCRRSSRAWKCAAPKYTAPWSPRRTTVAPATRAASTQSARPQLTGFGRFHGSNMTTARSSPDHTTMWRMNRFAFRRSRTPASSRASRRSASATSAGGPRRAVTWN